MPKIFDNIDKALLPALRDPSRLPSVRISAWGTSTCAVGSTFRLCRSMGRGEGQCCRLLVGMHVTPSDELRRAFRARDDGEALDNQTAIREKRKIAEDFRSQLTFGVPTNEDEAVLRQLSSQLPGS